MVLKFKKVMHIKLFENIFCVYKTEKTNGKYKTPFFKNFKCLCTQKPN